MTMLALSPRFLRARSLTALLAASAAISATQVDAIQINTRGLSNHSHDQFAAGDTPGSPFFTQTINSAGTPTYTIGASNGLTGSISAPGGTPTGSSTTVSGTALITGNATEAGTDTIVGTVDDWINGNQVPAGVTLSFDVTFTISSSNGRMLLSANGNTGNGLGISNDDIQMYGSLNTGEVLQISSFATTNQQWGGAATGGYNFTGGAIGVAQFTAFRSNNFTEASEGATLSDGTNTWGFGNVTGTVASGQLIENNYNLASRFSPAGGALPLTFTTDVGDWNLKGFQLSLPIAYDIVLAPPPTDADFDDDSDVDGADYLIWQQFLGVGINNQEGDANASGTVDAADLAAWQAGFVQNPAAVSVPEPATAALAAIGLLLIAKRKRC